MKKLYKLTDHPISGDPVIQEFDVVEQVENTIVIARSVAPEIVRWIKVSDLGRYYFDSRVKLLNSSIRGTKNWIQKKEETLDVHYKELEKLIKLLDEVEDECSE